MSEAVSFYVRDVTAKRIKRLAADWGCSQSQAVQRAVKIATGSREIPVTTNWLKIREQATVTILDELPEDPAGKRLHFDDPITAYQFQIGDRAFVTIVAADLDDEALDAVAYGLLRDEIPKLRDGN